MVARRGWATEVGVLWGEQHPEFGVIESLALDRRCAVALSAGRVPKPTPKIDPNEDAVLAVRGVDGYLLAVADGHRGADAARGALVAVAAAAVGAPQDATTHPERFVDHLLDVAADGVAEALRDVDEDRARSRTALTLALVGPGRVIVGTAGDTVAAQVGGRRFWGRADPTQPYLGPNGPVPRARRQRLHRPLPLVAASDGLTDFLDDDWRDSAAALLAERHNAEDAARGLVEAACAAGAGDNIAVAVLLGPHGAGVEQPVLGFRSVEAQGLRLVTRPPVRAPAEAVRRGA